MARAGRSDLRDHGKISMLSVGIRQWRHIRPLKAWLQADFICWIRHSNEAKQRVKEKFTIGLHCRIERSEFMRLPNMAFLERKFFMRSIVPQVRAGAGLILPILAILMILLSVFLPKACFAGKIGRQVRSAYGSFSNRGV